MLLSLLTSLSYAQKLSPVDSLPLFDDSHFFNFINTDTYDKDTILGFSYPRLDLSFLNSKGEFLSKITQKGDGPGLLGKSGFIDVSVGASGDVYVLRQDNAYAVYIYGAKGAFKKKVNLFRYFSDVFPPTFYSSFHVQDSGSEIILTLSLGSTVHSPFSLDHYQKDHQIAQFHLAKKSFEMLRKEKKLLLASEPEIAEAIKNNQINWYRPSALFSFDNGKFYKSSMYSRQVRVYDPEFKLIESLDLEMLPKLKNSFSAPFKEKRSPDLQERTKMEHQLLYENVNIWNVQAKGDVVLVQMNEPKELGRYVPLTQKELQQGVSVVYENIVIVKNIKTKEERLFKLPIRFQGKISLLNSEYFFIQGTPSPDVEENYLYKFSIN